MLVIKAIKLYERTTALVGLWQRRSVAMRHGHLRATCNACNQC